MAKIIDIQNRSILDLDKYRETITYVGGIKLQKYLEYLDNSIRYDVISDNDPNDNKYNYTKKRSAELYIMKLLHSSKNEGESA